MRIIDRINDWVGEKISWLTLGLVVVFCLDVVCRYLFNFSANWILDIEWHFFSLIFLLGSGYTLLHDKHVRVDVYYARFAIKKKATINIIGHIVFLIPWCLLLIYTGYNYTMNSWYMREGSAEPGGLPARYLIKSMIVLGFFLLLIQGVSQIFKDIKTLKGQ